MRATLGPVRLRSPRTALAKLAWQPIRFRHEYDFSASYQLMTRLMRLLGQRDALTGTKEALRSRYGGQGSPPPFPASLSGRGTPVRARVLTRKSRGSPHPSSCFPPSSQENG